MDEQTKDRTIERTWDATRSSKSQDAALTQKIHGQDRIAALPVKAQGDMSEKGNGRLPDSEDPCRTQNRALRQNARSQDQGAESKERLWTPMFIVILASAFCVFMMCQGINSSASVFIEMQGGPAVFSGILALVFSLSSIVARLVTGPLIDRRGRRLVLLAGCAAFTMGSLGVLLDGSPAAFIVWRAIQGVGFAAGTTAASTAAADILPLARLGEGIGYYGLAQALAMTIGPALGLWLVGTDPAENVFLGMALVGTLGCLLALRVNYEKHPDRLPTTSAYRRRVQTEAAEATTATRAVTASGSAAAAETAAVPTDAVALERAAAETAVAAETLSAVGAAVATAKPATAAKQAIPADSHVGSAESQADSSEQRAVPVDVQTNPLEAAKRRKEPWWKAIIATEALPGVLPLFLLTPTFGFSIYFCSLYGTMLGLPNAGLYFSLSAITMIAARFSGKAFMDKRPPLLVHTAAAAGGIAALSLLMFAVRIPALYYAAGLFYGLCMGLGMPLGQSVAVKSTPSSRWGAANALFQLAGDLGIGFSAVLWGAVNDTFGFTASMACALALCLVSVPLAYLVFPHHGLSVLKARED